MIIKKFLASTEKEAIEMAKEELGSEAVVMNIKKVQPKGLARIFVKAKVEVTAALDEVRNDAEEGKTSSSAADSAPIIPPMQEPRRKEDSSDEEKSIQDKLKKLEALLEKQMQEQNRQDEKPESVEKEEEVPENREIKKEEDSEDERTVACKELIQKQLVDNEVDEEIAKSVMDDVNKALPRNASVNQILTSVYQKIILMLGQPYVIDITKKGRTKFVFFLGSTGVGKTTTIAKIASRLKLEKQEKVALITADTYRIAAVEQLKTYANILSIPLKVVYSADELGDSLEELSQYDICLVDTAGSSHKNKSQMKDVQALIEQIPIADRQVYLVLNASTKYSDLQEIAKVYSDITDFSIIFTKLDETSSSGVMLNMHIKTTCPLSYVTYGQNVPDDIAEMNPQKIAKKLLGRNTRE